MFLRVDTTPVENGFVVVVTTQSLVTGQADAKSYVFTSVKDYSQFISSTYREYFTEIKYGETEARNTGPTEVRRNRNDSSDDSQGSVRDSSTGSASNEG